MILRLLLLCLALAALTPGSAPAQAVVPPTSAEQRPDAPPADGAPRQTLEDVLARQKGLDNNRHPTHGSAADAATEMGAILGTRGAQSDAAVWEGLRFGTEAVKVSAGGPPARVVMQDGGMTWLSFRRGPLSEWGGSAILGTLALLALFYLIRGRIRIDRGWAGIAILRFTYLERFGHWLLAGSFLLLGLSGLITLFGRKGLIPWMGHDAYALTAHWSKLIHNNVAWAFIVGLVWVFVSWVLQNIPNRTDLVWLAKGGGIIGHAHPPAWKFNAGQKIVFWAVILLGGSVAASGLSLLFPFQLPMFAATFQHLNDWGSPACLGWTRCRPSWPRRRRCSCPRPGTRSSGSR